VVFVFLMKNKHGLLQNWFVQMDHMLGYVPQADWQRAQDEKATD
jgi:hypothetical protein